MKILRQIFLLFFLMSYAVFAKAQASFNLKVSDKTIGESDMVEVEYEIVNATTFNNFAPPVFTDWQITSGPSYTEQTVINNNQLQRTVSYSYNLIPQKKGDLNVPGASVTADGKKLFCDGVTVHVSKKSQTSLPTFTPKIQPSAQLPSLFNAPQIIDPFAENSILKPNENPQEKIHNNMFVKAFANKTTCFVGEPILVTYELFSGLQSVSKVDKQPTFSGCSVIEMTTDDALPLQKINGKMYRVFLIRKVQLIPLQEGELKLDAANVTNTVTFSAEDNPYQTKDYNATLTSNPLSIQVKSLPEKNKPKNFSGIIGKFKITAKAENKSIAEGENNNLQIIISGEGNMQSLTAPTFQWPHSFEHFDGTDSQRIDKLSFPLNGETTFNIPFIGTKEGTAIIPEIKFSYFDPAIQVYKTIHTDSIKISITHALAKNNALKNIATEDVTNRKYLWIVPAIALTVGLVWMISSKYKKKNDTQENKIKAENKKHTVNDMLDKPGTAIKIKTDFEKELSLLQLIPDNSTFFMHVRILLTQAIKEKLDINNNTESSLLSALQQINDKQLSEDAQNIYKIYNQCLYSPIINDDIRISTYQQLASVIERLGLILQSTYL